MPFCVQNYLSMKHLLICLIIAFHYSGVLALSIDTKDNAIGIKVETIAQPLIDKSHQTFIGIEYLRKITPKTSLRAQLSLISESSLNISKGTIGLMYDLYRKGNFLTYGTLDFTAHQAFDENAIDETIYSASTGIGLAYKISDRFSIFGEQKLVTVPFNSGQKIKLFDGTQFGLRLKF